MILLINQILKHLIRRIVICFCWFWRSTIKTSMTKPPKFYRKHLYRELEYRSTHRRCLVREGVMHEACNFIKKETLAQVFSREFCEICKNTFFAEHLWMTVSVNRLIFTHLRINPLRSSGSPVTRSFKPL